MQKNDEKSQISSSRCLPKHTYISLDLYTYIYREMENTHEVYTRKNLWKCHGQQGCLEVGNVDAQALPGTLVKTMASHPHVHDTETDQLAHDNLSSGEPGVVVLGRVERGDLHEVVLVDPVDDELARLVGTVVDGVNNDLPAAPDDHVGQHGALDLGHVWLVGADGAHKTAALAPGQQLLRHGRRGRRDAREHDGGLLKLPQQRVVGRPRRRRRRLEPDLRVLVLELPAQSLCLGHGPVHNDNLGETPRVQDQRQLDVPDSLVPHAKHHQRFVRVGGLQREAFHQRKRVAEGCPERRQRGPVDHAHRVPGLSVQHRGEPLEPAPGPGDDLHPHPCARRAHEQMGASVLRGGHIAWRDDLRSLFVLLQCAQQRALVRLHPGSVQP